jgi:hypothetical protein
MPLVILISIERQRFRAAAQAINIRAGVDRCSATLHLPDLILNSYFSVREKYQQRAPLADRKEYCAAATRQYCICPQERERERERARERERERARLRNSSERALQVSAWPGTRKPCLFVARPTLKRSGLVRSNFPAAVTGRSLLNPLREALSAQRERNNRTPRALRPRLSRPTRENGSGDASVTKN